MPEVAGQDVKGIKGLETEFLEMVALVHFRTLCNKAYDYRPHFAHRRQYWGCVKIFVP